MLKNIFRLTMFIILMNGVLVMVTPVLTLNSLLYPVRIDSLYVTQEQLNYETLVERGKADTGRVFIYSPAQLKLNYLDLTYTLPDKKVLRGWLAIDSSRALSPLLLIIPGISDGAINYINSMKQFNDRGFNVCVIDMQGQGRSDGEMYNPEAAVTDVKELIAELKKMPFIDRVAILGINTGAGIAIKIASESPYIADVIVLQNPPSSLSNLIRQQAISEWGEIIQPLLPSIIRSYEQRTQLSVNEYEFETLISDLTVPQMMVVANYHAKSTIDETVVIYKASSYFRKRLLTDRNSFQKPAGTENSKQYFDKISAFINSSLPGKKHKSRFRKLAMF